MCLSKCMDQQTHHQRSTWLSLVAETAGVSGATVVRVPVRCPRFSADSATVYVQVRSRAGAVVGAARQTIRGADLREGVALDLGVELEAGLSGMVVAWVEERPVLLGARAATVPDGATRAPFEPFFPSVLLLHSPGHNDLAA